MTINIGSKRIIADTSRYLAFPVAAHLGGLTIASWTDKLDHYSKQAETWLSSSTDGGRTWGNTRLLTGHEAATAAIATHPTAPHKWAVLEWASQPYRGWIRTSPDGVSWSEKKTVTWPGNSWTFPCGLTWLHDGTQWGRMIAICYGGLGTGITESRDGGTTWTPLPRPTDTVPFVNGDGENETTITETHAGDWLMLTRQDQPGEPTVWARRSSDEGQTWTQRRAAFKSKGMPKCAVMPDGTLIATVRDAAPDSTPESWAIAISVDDGQTWKTQTVSDGWMMYGQVAVIGPGQAVLVGASQNRASSTDCDVWARPLAVPTRQRQRLLTQERPPQEQWLIGSFATGEVKAFLPVEEGSSWSADICGSQMTAQLTITKTTETLLQHVIPWRDYMAVIIGDQIMCAGPIISDSYDADSNKWVLRGRGAEEWVSRRFILPTRARQDNVWFSMYDWAKKEPAAWAKMKWENLTWPEIGAAVIKHALSWKGISPWAVDAPNIIVPTQKPFGDKTSFEVDGMDFASVGSMLDEMEKTDGGVEWQFRPEWKNGDSSTDIIQWRYVTGAPLITSRNLATWAHDRVANLRTSRDASRLTTLLHATGGRQGDGPTHVTTGGAGSTLLLETLDSSNSHIDDPKRLREVAKERLRYVGRLAIDYDFQVPMAQTGLWRPGDFALLIGDPQARFSWQARVPHLAAETRLRITGRSANAGDQFVTVHTQHLAPEDDNAWLQAS
ncbi:sialidase family protein [uncultured Tessaracoccus sp.]|uniref:sialidase family protein n=1 Tax=uncultured Tessaracoccus sp. TaxID=905023 RepID=UPI002611D366|nr:sialidase family protein [uncultured Tessaracoccus sp.]